MFYYYTEPTKYYGEKPIVLIFTIAESRFAIIGGLERPTILQCLAHAS
jgi:hypothetical protein